MSKTKVEEQLLFLNYDNVISSLKERVNVSKKISASEDDIETNIKKIFKYITLFNSLNENDVRVLNRDFDQIQVIEEFAMYITPIAVKYDISQPIAQDVLVRPVVEEVDKVVLSYEDFINEQTRFRGFLRKDMNTNTVKLSDIKIKKSVPEVFPIAAFDIEGTLKCRYMDKPYIPIVLKPWVSQYYKPAFYNSSTTEIITDFLSEIKY